MMDYWMPFRIWCDIENSLCSETHPEAFPSEVEQYISDECGLARQFKNICSDGIGELIEEQRDDDEYALYKVADEKLFIKFLLRWS
jgi:hypothetical protein